MPTIVDDETNTSTAPGTIERAQAALTEAVLRGSQTRIRKAQSKLEQATVAASRQAERERALQEATARAAQVKREQERADRKARADAAEAKLREQTPVVVFEIGDRRLVVAMSATGVETGWSVEAVRRISWAIAHEFSERVTKTRSTGEVAPPTDFLTSLLSDHTNGIGMHLKRGIVRVEDK